MGSPFIWGSVVGGLTGLAHLVGQRRPSESLPPALVVILVMQGALIGVFA